MNRTRRRIRRIQPVEILHNSYKLRKERMELSHFIRHSSYGTSLSPKKGTCFPVTLPSLGKKLSLAETQLLVLLWYQRIFLFRACITSHNSRKFLFEDRNKNDALNFENFEHVSVTISL